MTINFWQQKKQLKMWAATAIIWFLYFLPYLIFGENSYVLIHDYLDFNFSLFKLAAEKKYLFLPSHSPISELNNFPRLSLGISEYNVTSVLFILFKPFTAFLINTMLIHAIAMIGMFLLLNKHASKQGESYVLSALVALCFSMLPFWPGAGATISSLPLAMFAFLNIRKHKQVILSAIIIFFVPFYSSFFLSYFAFIGILCLIIFYDLIALRKINTAFVIALFVFLLLFIAVEYRLFYSLVHPLYVSHRTEFHKDGLHLFDWLYKAFRHLRYGQYHAFSLQNYSIKYALFISFAIMALENRNLNEDKKNILKLLSALFVIAFFYGFWSSTFMTHYKNNIFLFKAFNLSRIHFLDPLLWFVLFFYCLKVIHLNRLKMNSILRQSVIAILILFQVLVSFQKSHFYREWKKNTISYKQFYSEKMFDDIALYINKPKSSYKVASVGLFPSIALYNGFQCIDFYLVNYPLQHKYLFGKIISPELDKNKKLHDLYMHWGSRSYLFSHEIGRNFLDKPPIDSIQDLTLDFDLLKNQNVHFIFSRVEILNNENSLKFLKKFKDKNSPWDIYLYEVL